MIYRHLNDNIHLTRYDITVGTTNISNVFSQKTNTLNSILIKKEYSHLRRNRIIQASNPQIRIGELLMNLKNQQLSIYKEFLNKHGDLNYCTFSVIDAQNEIGVYFIKIDEEFKYVGRCGKTSFKKRFKDYGKISPTNVFKHGQSTNCHINNKINESILRNKEIKIGFLSLPSIERVIEFEKEILKHGQFQWNIQKR